MVGERGRGLGGEGERTKTGSDGQCMGVWSV
jgi:hypothetical protein